MLGYVNVFKDELKIKNYNIYRSFYCGLCKTLGREFSQRTRLLLSYDFTFLALVLSSLFSDKQEIKNENCIIHPFAKRPVLKEDDILTYSAYMSVLVTYFKLKDDLNDKKGIKSILKFIFLGGQIKKVKKKYPVMYGKIKENIDNLTKLEREECCDVDVVADPFGKLLADIFTPEDMAVKDSERRILWEFGYNLGRFIYIIDALDDIKEDIENKNYNPFLKRFNYKGEEPLEFIKKVYGEYDMIVTLTLERIASAFELMDFKKNRELIENIIYLGLRLAKDKVLKGEKNGSV